jgi:hypothetical protein
MSRRGSVVSVAGILIAAILILAGLSYAAVEFVTDVQLPNCWASGVALKDHYLLTCGNEETKALWILDIADPARPKVVSTWGPYYGFPMDVAVQGDYAYVCDAGSLLVFSISDPANPALVSTLAAAPSDWPEGRDVPRAFSVVVAGSYAYLASRAAGLSVVDVSDPANPSIVGRCDVPGTTSSLCVAESYAYLAAAEGGVQIISVIDPANPRRVSEWRPVMASAVGPGGANGMVTSVRVRGNVAFALWLPPWGGCVALTALDVSDPASPQVLSQNALPGMFGEGYYANAVGGISGDYAFVIARDSLTTVDISNPSAMTTVGSFSLPSSPTRLGAEGVGGDWVPRAIQRPHSWFRSFSFDEERRVGYLIDALWGLWVLDMSDLANPVLMGAIPTAGEARVIRVMGDQACLSDWNGGLFVFDVSDPTHAALRGQYYGSSMHGFHADGRGRVFIPVACQHWPPAVGNEGQIMILDVSSPATVKRAGAIVPPVFGAVALFDGSGVEVFWFEGLLYVTHRGELFAYGFGPDGPVLLGHVLVVPTLREHGYECPPTPVCVRRVGPKVLAYVASDELGLSVVDVTDGAAPVVLGSLDQAAGSTAMIDVVGDYAYVAHSWSSDGIWIVNVSDPDHPEYVATFAGGGSVWLDVVGDTAWVANYWYGVYRWDVSNPASPSQVEGPFWHTSRNNFSLTVSGEYLYRADVGALEVYRITP